MRARSSVVGIGLLVCLSLLLPLPVAAGRCFLPIVQKPPTPNVVGVARFGDSKHDVAPVVGRNFALPEVIGPGLAKGLFRMNEKSPRCVSDGEGRLRFYDAEPGIYVLALEVKPMVWKVLWDLDGPYCYAVEVVDGETADFGMVWVDVNHLWAEQQ